MTDDIVTRLRAGLFYEVWDDLGIHWKTDIRNKDIWDAVKEIERLRKIVEMMVGDYTEEYGGSFNENMEMIEREAIEYLPEIKPRNERQW